MKTNLANCPQWLSNKISKKGGSISFYEFMQIVLNDPKNGFYGSGKAKIAIDGDFVTSSTISDDFAFLLAKQILDWLKQISKNLTSIDTLSVTEVGSGNGSLMKGIIKYLDKNDKNFLEKISFKIIEFNPGMIEKQKKIFRKYLDNGINIKWLNFDQIENASLNGVILANEVLDAFPVERIQYYNGELYRQAVSLNEDKNKLFFQKSPLTKEIKMMILNARNNLDINIPPKDASDGWTTELQIDNLFWLRKINKKLSNGILLIIDYALEARKYYSAQKTDGTLLAYKNQKAYNNPLVYAGDCDLTSHVCIDLLIHEAKVSGFKSIGCLKQGEALLALGLAEKIYDIQKEFKDNLSFALLRRESLLRLVDPISLGNFRWFIFQKINQSHIKINSICLR